MRDIYIYTRLFTFTCVYACTNVFGEREREGGGLKFVTYTEIIPIVEVKVDLYTLFK